jgi:hypothetical protein
MGTGYFPGVKRPGRGVDNTHSSSAEAEERVELYLYSTSGPSWPVTGWQLPYLYFELYLTHIQGGLLLATHILEISQVQTFLDLSNFKLAISNLRSLKRSERLNDILEMRAELLWE